MLRRFGNQSQRWMVRLPSGRRANLPGSLVLEKPELSRHGDRAWRMCLSIRSVEIPEQVEFRKPLPVVVVADFTLIGRSSNRSDLA